MESEKPHKRRERYSGKNPRSFALKYKELAPEKYPETVAKVVASGKTPAGMHRSIMVDEILEVLRPQQGEFGVDCTLGYGGHARELLQRLSPNGRLVGLDVDPIEIQKTEKRLRAEGFSEEVFGVYRSNFAGVLKVLAVENRQGADVLLADLGLSSMQIDDPARGFSVKFDGPLDMRMNPAKGKSAGEALATLTAEQLEDVLRENADEPHAQRLAGVLAGRTFTGTQQLAKAIRHHLQKFDAEEQMLSVRRVFQALRILVNEEFLVLETLLRHLPNCMNAGGRIAIMSFHSGEDRRVKRAFEQYYQQGIFSAISSEVIRASAKEKQENPRSTPAKLRWAIRS